MTDSAARSKLSPLVCRACALWKRDETKHEALPLIAEIVRRAQKSGDLSGPAEIVLSCRLARPAHLSDEQGEEVESKTLTTLSRPGVLESFRGDSTFGTWIARIAENHAKNLFRGNDRRKAGHYRFKLERLEKNRISSFASSKADIERAKGKLSKEDKQRVELWERLGSYQAIADELDMPYGTARNQVIKSRTKLDSLLPRPKSRRGNRQQ